MNFAFLTCEFYHAQLFEWTSAVFQKLDFFRGCRTSAQRTCLCFTVGCKCRCTKISIVLIVFWMTLKFFNRVSAVYEWKIDDKNDYLSPARTRPNAYSSKFFPIYLELGQVAIFEPNGKPNQTLCSSLSRSRRRQKDDWQPHEIGPPPLPARTYPFLHRIGLVCFSCSRSWNGISPSHRLYAAEIFISSLS